ncbi:DnaJ-domain-containing protein [Hanseniaspora valbyensis NRRL Y-1626]|uniref:DnaJ-domain-containing protein n=1 Tax=Hanseniaspora valbyensis NRRL Y-1626 TaxID=766949 RepID=A0A1B7TGM5_9ASCO|nr:DnaJ-domain-containing protein [Hanseniaspora valbyensis NRRL Y-1626]
MSFQLPAVSDDTVKVSNLKLSIHKRKIEPIGEHFIHHSQRAIRNHTFSEYDEILAEKQRKYDAANSKAVDPDEALFDEKIEDESMFSIEARHWKSADLYMAMGLSKLRYKATSEQIIKAHRRQVLMYHPDKTSAATNGASLKQDSIFKIIQKAFEVLTNDNKRKQYDSCDPKTDVLPPKQGSKYDFYEAWGPVFDSEARFSKKPYNVSLGDASSSKEDVEKFYAFWNRFDSWRTFEFLDEDVPDDSSNRDHKRYIEKKNKAARDKKKTLDNTRLAKLVERAFSEDPRIRAYKEEEKKAKEQKKWEAGAAARAAEEAKAKAEEEAKKAAEEETKKAADSKANSKKAKEAAKSAKKKNKRAIRGSGKDQAFFGDADKEAVIEEQIGNIVDALNDEQLVAVAAKMTGDAASVKAALQEIAKTLAADKTVAEASVSYFL